MVNEKFVEVPLPPPEHRRTLRFMFEWSREFLKRDTAMRPSEKAMCAADIQQFVDWLNDNWPRWLEIRNDC